VSCIIPDTVQFEVVETTEQVFVGLRSKFHSLHPIVEKHFSKTKYTALPFPQKKAGYIIYDYGIIRLGKAKRPVVRIHNIIIG
jgi:hypothetical protein